MQPCVCVHVYVCSVNLHKSDIYVSCASESASCWEKLKSTAHSAQGAGKQEEVGQWVRQLLTQAGG